MGNWVQNIFVENETRTIVAAVVVALVIWQIVGRKYLSGPKAKLNLPPGPRNLPLVGAMFSVDAKVDEWYDKMAKKFGKIFYFRVGPHGMLVVSSAEGAEEVLKTKDAIFAHRPNKSFMKAASHYVGFDCSDLFYSSYNEQYKSLKKLLNTNFFNASRIALFENFRRREGCILVKEVQKKIDSGGPVDVNFFLHEAGLNDMSIFLAGKRYSDSVKSETDEYKHVPELIRGAVKLFFNMNIGDLFPWLAWLDLQNLQKQYKEYQKLINKVFEQLIKEHKAKRNEKDHVDQDFVDLLLTLHEQGQITEKAIMGCILDLIVGGTDTGAITVEWSMIELAKNTGILAKLQKEIDDVVGKDRRVEESDLPHLPYLQAVINEIFRLHPPAPFLVPHFTEQPTTLQGFYVPANTTVMVNLRAIQRDPAYWKNPEKFDPERFMSHSTMLNVTEGSIFSLAPFGSGRRRCPGNNMAMLNVQRRLTTLLHAFDWSPPPGQTVDAIDATESYTGLLRPKTPLVLTAKPRLAPAVYFQ